MVERLEKVGSDGQDVTFARDMVNGSFCEKPNAFVPAIAAQKRFELPADEAHGRNLRRARLICRHVTHSHGMYDASAPTANAGSYDMLII
jgi:hypothetical protein